MLSDINNEPKWAVSRDFLRRVKIGSCLLFAYKFQRFAALPPKIWLVVIQSRAGIMKKAPQYDNDSDCRHRLLSSIWE